MKLQYLRSLRFIKSDFVDYLELSLNVDLFGPILIRQVVWTSRIEGPMVQTMMFEDFVLAIVNELYFRRIRSDDVLAEGGLFRQKLMQLEKYSQEQLDNEPPFLVSDFGTRRRYSFEWQKHVVKATHAACTKGISWKPVMSTRQPASSPIGTMAHGSLQALSGLDVRLRNFQRQRFGHKEYRGLRHCLDRCSGNRCFLT